jgi:hypothetical protein
MVPDKRLGHVHVIGRRAPDGARQLVEKQDQAEGGQHVVEVVARIEPRGHDAFNRKTQRRAADDADQRRDQKESLRA